MRRLLTISIISFFALPSVFADNAPCDIPIESQRYGTKTGKVTCLHCRNMDDYANFGAANMVDNMDSYTTMYVTNGRNTVKVSAAFRSNPTFLNWGYGIFSINQRSYDRMNLDVSAQLRSGRVSGQPWVNHVTPKSHMRNTCKVLAEEERKAALDYAKAEALAGDTGITAGMSHSDIQRLLRGSHTMLIPRPRTRVCTSGGGGCTESQ